MMFILGAPFFVSLGQIADGEYGTGIKVGSFHHGNNTGQGVGNSGLLRLRQGSQAVDKLILQRFRHNRYDFPAFFRQVNHHPAAIINTAVPGNQTAFFQAVNNAGHRCLTEIDPLRQLSGRAAVCVIELAQGNNLGDGQLKDALQFAIVQVNSPNDTSQRTENDFFIGIFH